MRRWGHGMVLMTALLATLTVVAPTAGAVGTRTVKGKVTLKKTGEPVVGIPVSIYSEPGDQGVSIHDVACTNAKGVYVFKNVDTQLRWHLQASSVRLIAIPPCPNSNFEPPSGKQAMLRYDHPGHHGEWNANDYVSVPEGSDPLRINIKLRTAKNVCYDFKATMHGTSGADTINGTNKTDIIAGKGGNDTITGRGGTDFICGDGGNDTLKGGGADDFLLGGAGNKDRMVGGPADDFCVDTAYKRADCEFVFP